MRAFAIFVIGLSLGVVAAILLIPDGEPSAPKEKEEEWDIVDEASAESFPASDSPAY